VFIRRRTTNQYFCLPLAARQRAKPFQKRLQARTAKITNFSSGMVGESKEVYIKSFLKKIVLQKWGLFKVDEVVDIGRLFDLGYPGLIGG
jgi:hypothetical protein